MLSCSNSYITICDFPAHCIFCSALQQKCILQCCLPQLHHKCNAIIQSQHIHLISYLVFRDLGRIAGGMSCNWLKFWTNATDFFELLQFVSELPGGVRPALVRNCRIPPPSILSLSIESIKMQCKTQLIV